MNIPSQSQPISDAPAGATTSDAEPSASKRLGYEAEQRILAYLRDGDIDKHPTLHSDVQRLYSEMLTWRIAAQRWTPGGSEFMDPIACTCFIQQERQNHARAKLAIARLTKALGLATQDTSQAELGPGRTA